MKWTELGNRYKKLGSTVKQDLKKGGILVKKGGSHALRGIGSVVKNVSKDVGNNIKKSYEEKKTYEMKKKSIYKKAYEKEEHKSLRLKAKQDFKRKQEKRKVDPYGMKGESFSKW